MVDLRLLDEPLVDAVLLCANVLFGGANRELPLLGDLLGVSLTNVATDLSALSVAATAVVGPDVIVR